MGLFALELISLAYVKISVLVSVGLVIQGCKTRTFPFCCVHCIAAEEVVPAKGSGALHTQTMVTKC